MGLALEHLLCQELLWLTQSSSLHRVDGMGFCSHILTFDRSYDVSRQSNHSRGFDPDMKPNKLSETIESSS